MANEDKTYRPNLRLRVNENGKVTLDDAFAERLAARKREEEERRESIRERAAIRAAREEETPQPPLGEEGRDRVTANETRPRQEAATPPEAMTPTPGTTPVRYENGTMVADDGGRLYARPAVPSTPSSEIADVAGRQPETPAQAAEQAMTGQMTSGTGAEPMKKLGEEAEEREQAGRMAERILQKMHGAAERWDREHPLPATPAGEIPTPDYGAVRRQAEGYYAHLTPEAANEYIREVLHDTDFIPGIVDGAKAAGMSEADYVRERLAPQIQQQVYDKLVEEKAPQGTLDYVASGVMNSLIGQIWEAAMLPREERNLRQVGRAVAGERANGLAKAGNMFVGVVGDLPVFSVLGGVNKFLTRGMAAASVRNNTMAAATQIAREMLTFGEYDALNSAVGQWYREGETDWRKVAAAAGKGVLSGAAMGMFGVGSSMLTRDYIARNGFGRTWNYTFRGVPRELRSTEATRWATDMAGRSAILSLSGVLGQRIENPDFDWNDVAWGEEFKHALMLNLMLDVQNRVMRAGRRDGFEGGVLTADDVSDLQRAGLPVRTERQAYDYVAQTGRLGVLNDRRLSMEQKQKMADLLGLRDRDGGALMLQVNPTTESRIGRTLDERWTVDEYDALGTLNSRRTFGSKEEAEAYREEIQQRVDENRTAMLEGMAEARRQTIGSAESIRVVAEEAGVPVQIVATAVGKEMRGESLSETERTLAEEVKEYAETYLEAVPTLSEEVAVEVAARHGQDGEWLAAAREKGEGERTADERTALREYADTLDELLNENPDGETIGHSDGIPAGKPQGTAETEAGRTLWESGDTAAQRQQAVRTQVARERLASVAGEEFTANLDARGEAALYDYLYVPDEYMPLVEDYMRQKRTTEAMDAAMEDALRPAMDAARRIVADMSPTADAQGEQEVQLMRSGEKTYVVRRQVGDVLMVTPIELNEDGTVRWESYDAEVTQAMKWNPRMQYEKRMAEDVVREMVPEYTMARELVHGMPTEEEVLAVEAEGGTLPSPSQGRDRQEADDMIGRSLSEEEADATISLMQERASEAPDIELTPENWLREFGEEGKVETPIGEVKMGENQYFKLARKGREGKLGMIRPTLATPDFIIEDKRPARGGSSERETSYVFVKTFTRKNGERYYHFTSVTVSKDGQEVVISNQERSSNRISKLLREGKVAWIDSAFSLHPMSQIGESIPLNDSSRPTNIDNQPARLGISSPERFEGKGTENIPDVQGNQGENSERANLSAQWTEDGRLSDGRGGSVWAAPEQTVEKLTEDMGGDRTAALRVVRNKSKQLRRDLEESDRRLDEITDAKEYKAEWDRNRQLRDSIEYWQEVDNSITAIQREAEMPEASKKMRSLMQQLAERLGVELNVTDDMLYEMRRADRRNADKYTEADARRTNGFQTKEGGIIVNSRSVRGLSWAFGHETGHELKDRNKEAYQRWKETILGMLDAERLQEEIKAKRENPTYEGKTEEELTDEIANDQIGEIMADPKKLETFVRQLNPNTLEHLWGTTKKWLKGMEDVTFEDVLESAQKAGGKVLDDIRERIDVWRGFKEELTEAERILAEAYKGIAPAPSMEDRENDGGEETGVNYSAETNPETLRRLENEETIEAYRAIRVDENGVYHSPMAGGGVGGALKKERTDTYKPKDGEWEKADEHPELATYNEGDEYAHITIDKGEGNGTLQVAYNPYIHTSRQMLNDQFTSAWRRPDLQVLKVEVPVSELTSGYRAQYAKNAVGETEWNEGVVAKQLPAEKKRRVILTRWDKPVGIVPVEEYARAVKEQLEGTDVEGIPFNCVTPAQREALVKEGVKILEPEKKAGTKAREAYEEWLAQRGEIQGLEGTSEKEVLDAVRADVERVLEENGVSGVTIKGMALNGSRMRGNARENSDLDVVMEVEGNVREDDLFNMLSDADLSYEGIKVDVNPIMRGKSGTLEEYMKRSRAYDDEMRFSAEIELHDKKTGDDDLAFGKKFVSLHSERDREAVSGQRERFAPTAQWREGVDDVMVHTTLATMRKKHGELHDRAKAGDVDAALKLVASAVKPEKVKALAEAHPNARVAFVHAEEATGRNAIPKAYAECLEYHGLQLADIEQINKPAHTGSDRVGRFFRRARFDGEVEQGREYILVDDHVTMGGTLRDLKDYIESKGGKVVAVSTLTASAGSTKLRPTEEQIRQLNEKGITNEQLERAGIADSFDGLTRSEAREILVLADAGGDRGSSQRREGSRTRPQVLEGVLRTEDGVTNDQYRKAGISEEKAGVNRRDAQEILVLADAGGDRGTPRGRGDKLGTGGHLSGVEKNILDSRRKQQGPRGNTGMPGRLPEVAGGKPEESDEKRISNKRSSERIAPEEGEHWLDYARRVAHIRRLAVDTNPSEAQKEAGNYKKGHLKLDGYNITIENPRGTTRSGKDADGKEWSVKMNYDYGYIRGTEGVDGDHIDVYLSEKPEEGNVYVVDQIDQRTGKFDEHKVMYGFPTEEAAREAYLSQYEDGWKIGKVTEVSREQFKKWVDSSHRKTKPFSEYKSLTPNPSPRRGEEEGVRFSAEDKEYAEAVAAGDKEKVDAMLRAEAKKKGYTPDSDYQGSLAFNGAAPSRNAYFETREERKKAFDEGDFEGDYSLGDFVKAGLDNHDLGWQLTHPAAASAGHQPTLESIRNLNNAIRSKDGTIRMYRAVDAKVKENSFRNGDWVTPSRKYAENHIELQDWKKGRIIEQEVKIDDIWWNGDDINEWGYDDGKGSVYKNTANNRKLLEPTYNDKGELIPLSERYNERESDIRFSTENALRAGQHGDWKNWGEKALTERNVNYFLFGMSNRYLSQMPGEWPVSKVRHKFETHDAEGMPQIDTKRAQREKDLVMPLLQKWRNELIDVRYSNVPTDAARMEIDSVIHDLDYSMNWYERVAGGDEDFYRTMDMPRFSAEREDPTENRRARGPIFYSNAQRAVEGIRQEKATPEQWLKMIEKAGGLKAGEDKWTGLSEWLQDASGKPKRTLTKQEVMDYIRENSIQVEETPYAVLEIESSPKMQELREEYDRIRLELEGNRSTLEVELDDFMDRMYKKYGRGWYNKLNEEELEYEERFDYLSSTEGTTDEKAFREMVKRYGDDFEMAFEVDVNGRLVPQYVFGETPVEAARYYLEISDRPIDSRRLEYTTEGLENKREIALTVPTIEPWNEGDEIHFGDAGEGRAVAWARFGETTDKDGNRVLVIDEIQSKRHQEGREKGYRTAEDVAEEERLGDAVEKAQEAYDEYTRRMGEKYDGAYEDIYADMTEGERAEADRLEQEVNATSERLQNHDMSDIPDAPFEKNWHELAMKRMLRLAAEEGYDKVAWTTGMQQAERYDIGKVIDQVERSWIDYATGEVRYDLQPKDNSGGISLFVNVKDGMVTRSAREEFEGKPLADVVGKELAEKMLEMEDYSSLNIADMNLGGEGMRGFYDQMLPRFMDKYGKRWGVKTYDQEYQVPDDGHVENGKMVYTTNYTWHTVDVTPEMRESVMGGQPMFSAEAETEYRRLSDIVEKPYRIEKLRNSKPVEITRTNEYPLERKSAKRWLKDNIKGEYINVDTGAKIGVSNYGIDKVTSHGEREDAHLKSLAAIPDMIRQSIYIGEAGNEKGNNKYESYQYYVCGLKIDGDDYTAKIVVGVKNGERYYDHELTQIEKGSLIDSLNEIAKPVAEKSEPVSGFTTAGDAPLPPYSAGKDKRLFSILQTNPQEIADARAKMREMEAEMAERPNRSAQEDVRFSAEGRSQEWKKAERELAGHGDVLRVLRDTQERDIEEVAAGVLARGGLLWADEGEGQYRKKGVKSMMGWSDGERKNFLGMFKTAENGGISVAEAGEAVELACREAGIPYDESDAMAGVNAIQDVLGNVETMSDLTRYVERRRIDEAYGMVEEAATKEREARDAWYMKNYGMTYDDYQETLTHDAGHQAENAKQTEMIEWQKQRISRQAEQLERLQGKLDELKHAELGRPLVIAQNKIIEQQQEAIREAKTEANRLKDELHYKKNYDKAYRELMEVKKQLSAFVRERMAADDMPFTSKRELNKLLSTIEHTNTLEQMEDAITDVKTVVNRSHLRHLRHRLARLMDMKVQGVNGRNMSVAKTVDERVRRIIEDIRGRVADIGMSGLEDDLDALLRERRQTRTAINDAQKNGQTEEADVLEAHWRDLSDQIQAKEGEIADLLEQRHGKGKIDVGQEINDLEEKFDKFMSKEKGVTWTETDADRLTALYGVQIIEESKEQAIEVNKIERSIADKWKEVYALREKLKDEALSRDEKKDVRDEINAVITRISAEKGLLADALQSEAESVQHSVDAMEELMDDGRNNLKKRVDAQLMHRMEILKGAFSDIRVEGKGVDLTKGKNKDGKEDVLRHALRLNIGSFEYMCKRISQSGLAGEDGWIYQHFVKGPEGVLEARNEYLRNMKEQRQRLNEKVTEIFGTQNHNWFNTDAWILQGVKAAKVMQRSGVSKKVDGSDVEREELPLSKGMATYLYMVWKMDDGKMKMKVQGFDEQSMQEIEDFIGPKYKQLADWLQDEYLAESRARYNERYAEMYNTSMARIKNYVPLILNEDAIKPKETLGEENEERRVQCERRAGSLINRTTNVLPVDITQSMFDVISDHVDMMENWYAFTRVRRDLDAILGSRYFMNQVNRNNKGYYQRFRNAATMACMSYIPPKADGADKLYSTLNKGLLAGNISWKLGVAAKQLLSASSALGYGGGMRYYGYLAKNLGENVRGRAIRWCIDNIPTFANRVDIGDVGNYRLDEKVGLSERVEAAVNALTKFSMLPNRAVDAFTCAFCAKSVYDYNMDKSRRAINSDASLTPEGRKKALEEAHRRAVMEADIFYNATQQSSEPAFMAPMQVSRSFIDRSLSAYMNSNLGYVRRMLTSALDVYNSVRFRKMRDAYERQYMADGMDKFAASEKANRKTWRTLGKGLANLMVFALFNNFVWDAASRGMLGFKGDPSGKDEFTSPWGTGWSLVGNALVSPFRGMPLETITEDFIRNRNTSSMLIMNELADIRYDWDKIHKEDDSYISWQLLGLVARHGTRIFITDPATLTNIYFGLEQMMLDGGGLNEKLIDLMFILSISDKQRGIAARNLYKDASLEEYVAAVAKAEKYLKRGESLAQWFPGMKYAEGDKFGREFNKLQKEWEAAHEDLKSMDEKEFDEMLQQNKDASEKLSLSDADKIYGQYLRYEDRVDDAYIERKAETWKKAEKAKDVLKKDTLQRDAYVNKMIQEGKIKAPENKEERTNARAAAYNDMVKRVKPYSKLKKKYDEYKRHTNKLKLQLDGGDNDTTTMETIRQLRDTFLREIEASDVE